MHKKLLALLLTFSLISSFFLLNASKTQALGGVVKISNSSNDVVGPQIVADSKGYLHAVWMEIAPPTCPPNTFCSNLRTPWDGQNPGIFYSRWNGDTWSTPIKISQNTDFAESPSIAVDSNNTIHIAWDDQSYDPNGVYPSIAYITRTYSGTWSSIENVPNPSGTHSSRFSKVTIDSNNNPNIFVLSTPNDSDESIYLMAKVNGTWTDEGLVSTKTDGTTPLTDILQVDARSDSNGNLHVVYWSSSNAIMYRKYSNGSFSTPVQLTTDQNLFGTKMAVTPGGQVFVSWYNANNSSVYADWTISGAWQSPVVLTNIGANSYWGYSIMGVTTDSKERAYVGWGEKNANNKIDLRYKGYVPGSGWQTTQDVALNNDDADTPVVYPDKWDNQHFAWVQKNSTTGRWELMYRVQEGTVGTIGTGGGSLTANPFNITQATLTVPSGALSASTQIGIQIGPVPENVNPLQVTIPKAYTFRPSGTTFSSPATARVYYTDAEAAGADETLLKPWLWDSQAATWSAMPVTNRNTTQNWMEVQLNHFSLYGISAPKVVVDWNDPTIKGHTLTYSFHLSYADGAQFRKLNDKTDTLDLVVKDSGGNVVKTFNYKKPGGPKPLKTIGDFQGEIDLNKAKLPSGAYSVDLLLDGSLIDTQSISF